MSIELPAFVGLPLFVALLLANGLFVAAEFALVTVRRTRIDQLASTGNAPARLVQRALGNLDFYIAASQLGITMATIAIGWFAEPVLASLIEPPVAALVGSFAPAFSHGIAIAVVFTLVTKLHIVIGEFVPKTIALEQPDKTSLAIAYPLQFFVRIFKPAIYALNGTGNWLLGLLGFSLRPIGDQPLAVEDLALTMESSASAGLISRQALDLTRHALQLATIEAHELMLPRNEIIGIPRGAPVETVLRTLAEHKHTRYPVYEQSLDDITGFIDAKKVLLDAASGDDWHRHIAPVAIVPESVSAQQVFEVARAAGTPLVIVIDEYGGTAGIISVFDIVQYLAGYLPDEYHEGEPRFRTNPDGTLTLSGLTRIVEIEEDLDLKLPDVDAVTVGGLVTALLQQIPAVGDEVGVDGYLIRVEAMDFHRVAQVSLRLNGVPVSREVRDSE